VDADGLIHLNDLNQQAKITSTGLWDAFTATSHALKKNNTKISFFSATPQGGGVALMRHALIRLWRM
jgi:alpha,alpha-trehalose phosphorylase (configuration-retaining)